MRRVIFSRKGFDSSNGGMPSAFVPKGEMVSFPIPASTRSDLIRYADIRAEGMSLQERVEQLSQGEGNIFPHQRCHHDPDLVYRARFRPSWEGWAGAFGQSGGANSHLQAPNGKERDGVEKGDLFLFFGWFREAVQTPEGLRFVPKAPDVHAFFGYLQIGDRWDEEDPDIPACFNDHPHPLRRHLCRDSQQFEPGTLYTARERLSIPGEDIDLPGYGVFRHSPKLVLTKKNTRTGKYEPRSFWDLPKFFDGKFHSKNIRREKEGPRKELCNTKGQWQECIANATPEIKKWALERIRIGMRAD